MKNIKDRLYNILSKKKEEVLFDIFISNYDNTDFYIGLIFNKKIDKYKVLFLPLSIIDNGEVEDYFCYQFIFLDDVDYLISIIENNELSNYNESFDKYVIELNTYKSLGNKTYRYKQFVSDRCMFDFFVTLFQYIPNYMDDLLRKIIIQFNTDYEVKRYTDYYLFDIYRDNLNDIFKDRKVVTIDYLEKIGNEYYGVKDSKRYLFNINNGILRFYSDDGILDNIIYSFICNILDKNFIKFSHLIFSDDIDYSLLCYGLDLENEELLIFNNLLNKNVLLKDIFNNKVKFKYITSDLRKNIHSFLSEKYDNKKVKELEKVIFP